MLMSECWIENPVQRPCFFHLVSTISEKLESIAGYLDFGSTPMSVGQSGMLGYDHLEPQLDEKRDPEHLNPVVIISDEDSGT